MGTEATGLSRKKAPVLSLVLVRSHATMVDDDGGAASTPSLGTPVTVPFLWEDAPGRPKPHSATIVPDGGGHDEKARLMPLKLPPRLQVPSTACVDHSLSPKTVLQGPYYSCTGGARTRRPPRTALRRVGSFRRTPSAAGGLLSRGKADKKGGREHDAAAPDASCSSSPSGSSSSSSSASFLGDDRSHGTRRRPADGRADPEVDEGAKGWVTITRFRRNRSLPSMTTTSHLWTNIRKSIKQIAPWS